MRLVAMAFDARDPGRLGEFWAGLLGRDVVTEADGVLLPGEQTQVGLRFVAADTEKAGLNRLHLHLTSPAAGDQQRTVERALALGGRHLDVGQRPDEGHVVVADPEGNELCVIEHGNRFLAGCGPLGEVACDGSRDVGVFWHRALGWPLVWDQDEETAIQAPAGGTKVSWGGPPVSPLPRPARQRFDLGAGDVAAAVARLTELGARRTPDGYADPDGNEFRVFVERVA